MIVDRHGEMTLTEYECRYHIGKAALAWHRELRRERGRTVSVDPWLELYMPEDAGFIQWHTFWCSKPQLVTHGNFTMLLQGRHLFGH